MCYGIPQRSDCILSQQLIVCFEVRVRRLPGTEDVVGGEVNEVLVVCIFLRDAHDLR